jgi:Reverse transcriptase (RNA-dependent DNA polymerase)
MLNHKFSTEFTQAASREIQILERKGTFQYVPRRSAKTTPLPLLWVFKYKFDSNGYLIKFKARLCVRGDLQTTEQDTYAATLAARTFKALTAIAAAFNLDIHQYDAISAFLNNRLPEEIFCYTPEGFKKAEYVWLLLRALYDLRQAPLLWYQEFTTALEQLSLQAIPAVNCLYANEWLTLYFFVNDVIVLCAKRNLHKLHKFEKALFQRYEMRSINELQ